MAFTLMGWYFIAFINGDAHPRWLECTKKVMTIPPLVGMIVFGIIGRNIHPYMDHFNDDWGANIRMVCLVVILTRGGMELSFSGKGLTVFLLTVAPQMFEASTIAGISKAVFDLPIYLCFSLGFVVGAVSPAVLVPSCMYLQDNGYGVDKEIPTTLIAAASFDDIIAITVFSIFTDLAFNKVAEDSKEPYESIYTNAYQIVTGLAVGCIVGAILGFSLKKMAHNRKSRMIKLLLILLILALFVTGVELSGFHESLYICVLFFGYMLNVLWGEKKPDAYLGFIWKYMSPFLFGTIGAAIDLGDLEFDIVPKAILVIFCGSTIRLIVTYLVVWQKKYTVKERIVIVCGWIPKATVQAAIGGVVLDRARDDIKRSSPDYEDYEDHGKTILTTAIICILMTAPLGAILTSNLGRKQQKEVENEEDEREDKNGNGKEAEKEKPLEESDRSSESHEEEKEEERPKIEDSGVPNGTEESGSNFLPDIHNKSNIQ
ncbi:unnamed protein product [Moneuplotes crassus]|uniref:Cation/H+ exchanger transmembrane domain-containing protein n=1 Tax=Euplotes crassus TaxID=5936 RepID=A0AAD1U9B9_EUPCR|nr:unnamed protein product [Moneuplotes crassus]